MSFYPSSIDPQLRDWLIAFVICMVAMFWNRICGRPEPAAEPDTPDAACEETARPHEERR